MLISEIEKNIRRIKARLCILHANFHKTEDEQKECDRLEGELKAFSEILNKLYPK